MKLFRATGVVVSLALVATLTPSAAQAKRPTKYQLVGPEAEVWCDPPHEPLDTPTVTEGIGSVIFSYSRRSNRIRTVC